MKTSESISQIAEAMAMAQAKMQNPKKTAYNPYFDSYYAPLPAVAEACYEQLHENGISVIMGGATGGDKEYIVCRLLHISGEWIEATYPLNPVKIDPQSLVSATTYARRTLLAAMAGLCPDEDDDGNAASGNTKEKLEAKKETGERVEKEPGRYKKAEQVEDDGYASKSQIGKILYEADAAKISTLELQLLLDEYANKSPDAEVSEYEKDGAKKRWIKRLSFRDINPVLDAIDQVKAGDELSMKG